MTRSITFFKRIAIAMMALALPIITPSYAGSGTTDALGMVDDVIVGHGNKGPYFLSWNQIDADTATVVLNGRTLRKSADYSMDSAGGMVSFNSVVLSDTIVRISYKKTAKSKSNSGGVSVPVTVSLLQGHSSSLNITGLYANNTLSSDTGKTVLGVGGDKAWSGGKVESMFLMSQAGGDSDKDKTGNLDRSALKFGNTMSLGALKLTGSYAKAGKDFAGSNAYGLVSGKQTMDLAGTYGISNNLQAAFKFQNAEQTAGSNEGNYLRVNEQNVTYAPSGATKVLMAHSTTLTGNSLTDSSNRSVETSKLRIDQKIGAKTSTAVSVENTSTTQGDTTDQIQTRQASLTTNAAQGVSVQGTVTQKESQVNGAEQNVTTAVTLAPISQVAVNAAFTETDSEKNGQSATTNLSVKLKPAENIVLEGKILDQSVADTDNYQRNVNLSATPVKNTKLTAQFSQMGQDTADPAVTKGAALEVSPFDNTKMSAGLKYIDSGENVMTIYDYAAATSPWKFFSLAGSLRNRQLEQDFAPDTKKLNVSLAPVDFVKLTGDYQENPEDTCGNVQQYKATAMGMKFTVGSIGLLTNYTSKDEYMNSRLSDEREVGLELPAFGHGKMKTGYKIARTLNGSDFSTNTYSLGYEHSLGSDFSLSLTGYYSQYMQDRMVMPDKAEYKSELNLGVKF